MAIAKIEANTGEIVKQYVVRATIDDVGKKLKQKIYGVADKIVKDMMNGMRVKTELVKSIDGNFIITHTITFKKKGKKK